MPFPDRQTVELETGRISYRQTGSGSDLVLLHGLAGNSRTWERQAEVFSHRCRVTAWDAPGYGGSDPMAEPVSAERYADALLGFLDALDLQRVILLGHSMGGVVASAFAGRYQDRLRALVLSCTLLGRRQSPGAPLGESYIARLADLERLGSTEYGTTRAESMTAPGCSAAILMRLAGIAAETRREGLEAAMRVIAEADNGGALARIDLPVLVLTGELDRTVSRETSEALIAALAFGEAQVQIVTLPGVAHAPYQEDAASYNAALAGFLDTVPQG